MLSFWFVYLNVFFYAWGLRINLHKSNLFGIWVAFGKVMSVATLTGCRPGKLPFSYLGLPVGASMTLIKGWKPIIDKF